jgi:hypothetical protein
MMLPWLVRGITVAASDTASAGGSGDVMAGGSMEAAEVACSNDSTTAMGVGRCSR